MQYSDYIIYVDESGDHGLTNIDPQYPIFVLTFCIFNKEEYATKVSPVIQRIKFKHFGHDNVVFHEHEIRKQSKQFGFLTDATKREEFMNDLSGLIKDAPMTIIAAVIRKDALVRRYIEPHNPYEIALQFCMERAFKHLGDLGQTDRKTHIVLEARGKDENNQLELEFRRILDNGVFRGRKPCFDIQFAPKARNLGGLQLADLTARPIGIRVLRPTQANRAYDTINAKLRKGKNGEVSGFGIKEFPR